MSSRKCLRPTVVPSGSRPGLGSCFLLHHAVRLHHPPEPRTKAASRVWLESGPRDASPAGALGPVLKLPLCPTMVLMFPLHGTAHREASYDESLRYFQRLFSPCETSDFIPWSSPTSLLFPKLEAEASKVQIHKLQADRRGDGFGSQKNQVRFNNLV